MSSDLVAMHSTGPSPTDASLPRAIRTSLWTVIGIGIVAYAACDMVHEVFGHGLMCALTGVRALSLSTVALETTSSSRLVAAAGSIANVVAGMAAMMLFDRGGSFSPARYFLWLFASVNLLNGTGYLLFSGVLDIGDWAVVISSLAPHSTWRLVMAATGAALYAGAISLIAANGASLVRGGKLDRREVRRLVIPAYLAGGVLFVAGAALNRVRPSLILESGVSSGFGAMAGLLIVPRLVEKRTVGAASAASPLRFSPGWVVAGALAAFIFIAILGPGIRLS